MPATTSGFDSRVMVNEAGPPVPLGAGVTVYAGAMVLVDTTTGHAVAGAAAAANRRVVGVASETVSNVGGAAAAVSVPIRRGSFCGWNNSATLPLTIADREAIVFFEDDTTVAKTGGATPVPVGRFVGFHTDGTPIVDMRHRA